MNSINNLKKTSETELSSPNFYRTLQRSLTTSISKHGSIRLKVF